MAVGGLEEVRVHARIIAATNLELEKEVAEGRFREDLYYRLNVVPIHIPPLRDRREDIPALIAHFLRKYTKEYGVSRGELSGPTVRTLLAYEYLGNVRELENIIERCVALGSEDIALSTLQGVPAPHAASSAAHGSALFAVHEFPEDGLPLDDLIAQLEEILFREALERTAGKKTDAAALLGITFRQFRYRLSKLEDKED